MERRESAESGERVGREWRESGERVESGNGKKGDRKCGKSGERGETRKKEQATTRQTEHSEWSSATRNAAGETIVSECHQSRDRMIRRTSIQSTSSCARGGCRERRTYPRVCGVWFEINQSSFILFLVVAVEVGVAVVDPVVALAAAVVVVVAAVLLLLLLLLPPQNRRA